MRLVFGDTAYWVALIDRKDQWHAAARAVSPALTMSRIVTTDEVLIEVLTFFSSVEPQLRAAAVRFARRTLRAPGIAVLEQTRDSFLAGLALYEQRPDKGYSLTDCISMEVMRQHGIQEVLTNDRHFTQEGFTTLLKAGDVADP